MSREDAPSLAEWLEDEPFTMAMSSKYFGFYAHAGGLSALVEHGLLPARTRGSSAGGLVATLWAAGIEPERIQEQMASIRREDFWDPGLGWGLLKGELFADKLRSFVGDMLMEDCSVPASVSVTDVYDRRAEEVSSGNLVDAVTASCAFPGLLRPVWISGRPKLDGGIKDRPGLVGAPSDERILWINLAGNGVRSWFDRGHEAAFRGRTNLSILEIAGIPKVTPFRLDAGMDAFQYARGRMEEALSLPVEMPTAEANSSR